MAFDLFITSPKGHTVKALSSPYATRLEVLRTVTVLLVNDGETQSAVDDFTDRVFHAPLGETVAHEASGTTFRTEEA